jgi:pimeloyl-ACP methyl ester carboxylesterase
MRGSSLRSSGRWVNRSRGTAGLARALTVGVCVLTGTSVVSGVSASGAPAPPGFPVARPTPPRSELRITTTSLPGAETGVDYSATLSVTGGASPYRWTVVSGRLPRGLVLDRSGLISGTPSPHAATETFVATAGDGRSKSRAADTFTITVSRRSATGDLSHSKLLHRCPGNSGALCGAVRVPLYWSSPDGTKLTVDFRVYPHSDQSQPALEPIVAMEGGPGLASIQSAPSYLMMIGPLIERHDLIVMDNRGTGLSDPIDCPALQHYSGLDEPGDYIGAVQDCAQQLGSSANAYGTDAVGDDLAYILGRLGVPQVDVYGDSYGDYSAQVFTLHHPNLVRALILDGTYNNGYNPFEPEDTGAMRRAWTLLCARSSSCRGQPILKEIGSFDLRLQSDPVVGVAREATGKSVPIDLTAAAFAQLVYDATFTYTEFRDLPAALRAFDAGDNQPLLRLAAEDIEQNAAGNPTGNSVGDFQAVSCHDYPTAWETSASVPVRTSELAAAIAKLNPDAFAPFTKSVYLSSLDENELVYGCLDWTTPTIPDPPFPVGVQYPDTPVLIFDGQFDQATPVFDALKVVRSWPNDTFVEVSNANHVTADYDFQNCTSVILQRFIGTLSAGDTDCARAMPPVTVVPDFPVSLSDAPAPRAVGDDAQSRIGRQAAWVTAQTIGDALARWFNLTYGNGHGLYGGSFVAHGAYYSSSGPMTLDLQGCRFVENLAVSGSVVWNRTSQVVDATVHTEGSADSRGTFTVQWKTGIEDWRTPATVTGVFAGKQVSVELPAPWVPQS